MVGRKQHRRLEYKGTGRSPERNPALQVSLHVAVTLCQRGQYPVVTEKGLMSPTTITPLAYVRIISFLFRAARSCRRCAKNAGGLGIPPERRFLKRLAAVTSGWGEGLKRDFESPSPAGARVLPSRGFKSRARNHRNRTALSSKLTSPDRLQVDANALSRPSVSESSLGIDVGITREYGNRTGCPPHSAHLGRA